MFDAVLNAWIGTTNDFLLFISIMLMLCRFLPLAAFLAIAANAAAVEKCPGYVATNVKSNGATLTANLQLAGTACNAYGYDLKELLLKVEYQTSK